MRPVYDREESMRCPYLMKKILVCAAAKRSYVPSLFEKEEYCRQKTHEKCPFFRAMAE